MSEALYRLLPQIDEALRSPAVGELVQHFGRNAVLQELRAELDALRLGIAHGKYGEGDLHRALAGLGVTVRARLEHQSKSRLRRVINATGVLLHTNLGRAPLSQSALQAIDEVARGYSTLEFNLAERERGSRQDHVEHLLCALTGAEAAFVVNNNAGAVLLALTALTKGREVVVSRGELVEVGGAFRIPEIIEQGGAKLKEVGATNMTHLRDYERALGPDTAALLKVHTSNFRIVGFTASVDIQSLSNLAHSRGLLAIGDLGSGVMQSGFGEMTVREALSAGLDIATCSGDKLMGGPQAGIIVGKRCHIDAIKQHPLARALRIDKLTLAALVATLQSYSRGSAWDEIPLLRMYARTTDQLEKDAESLVAALSCHDSLVVRTEKSWAQVGGGAMPETDILSVAVVVSSRKLSASALEEQLRLGEIPVIVRLVRDEVWVDMRTLMAGDVEDIVEVFNRITVSAR